MLCYISTVAVANDVETQRNGIVIVVWFDANYEIKLSNPLTRRSPFKDYSSWECVRASAIHVCNPDTPASRFRQSIVAFLAGQNQRSRLKFHVGESVELRYYLQGYGIPTENIPMTWSGTIKTTYLKNWMQLRKAIEDDHHARRKQLMLQLQRVGFPYTSGSNLGYDDSIMSSVVECPRTNDVVFRQGTTTLCQPGNARFRSLVESFAVGLRETYTDITTSYSFSPISTVVYEIIHKVIYQDRGRFLVWTPNHNDEKYGCWCIISDEDQIYSKIEYTVREHIRGIGGTATATATGTTSQSGTVSKAEKQKSNLQTSESSTSIFVLDGKETPSRSFTGVASNLLLGTTATAAESMPNKRAKISSSNSDDKNSRDLSSCDDDDDDTCQLFCRRG